MKINGDGNITSLLTIINDPLVHMYANAPDDIYQYAKKMNPMLKKAIEWSKAIVASQEEMKENRVNYE